MIVCLISKNSSRENIFSGKNFHDDNSDCNGNSLFEVIIKYTHYEYKKSTNIAYLTRFFLSFA